ncbi:MAG: HEAT repeat domain-containing protein [Isosphaeraceae bacterium]
MRFWIVPAVTLSFWGTNPALAAEPTLRVATGWKAELVVQAPEILFPTAIVVAPDGTVYLGQDPMDMPGPPTLPIDSVVAIRNGETSVFADKLWAVMGLEWVDDTLYVVHPPFLSAFRDQDGDGKAEDRVDLVTGLGPKLPGFSGINDHVASGVRLGMDGFLYVSIGDKGIPKAVGRDGKFIQLFGGGVIRVRPDGTDLEVVSTGERNPLSVALTATDEIFTYGNDDDSKKWPNSLTHHIVGGHYGYPYQFLHAPTRALPVTAGELGGSGTQGVCFNEDGLPDDYRGDLFFCDWGLQSVFRYKVERSGGTFRVVSKTPFVTRGGVEDFRPFSLAVSPDGASFHLVDWAYSGWLADGPRTGRLYRLTYVGKDRPTPRPRPQGDDLNARLEGLEHPALAVRLESQRSLARRGAGVVATLAERLRTGATVRGRVHALWTLDAIGSPEARAAIRRGLVDPEAEVRLQAVRSAGIRRDRLALAVLGSLLRDQEATIRRESAIALARIGDASAGPVLIAALGDPDPFVAWSVRKAIRSTGGWQVDTIAAALIDERTRDDALKLTDEAWEISAVDALIQGFQGGPSEETRARIVENLAGLYRTYPEWSGNWFGTNPLAGQFPQKTQPWDPKGMTKVQEGLTLALKDPGVPVRLQAIAGLILVGRPALPTLREALRSERDSRNLAAIAEGLGVLGDFPSAPLLGALLSDPARPENVRVAALEGLGKLKGPQALNARLSLVYDPQAPPSLVARALPSLGREGILPPNDLATFLEHERPEVRTAGLLALTGGKVLPEEVKTSVISRLSDPSVEVRRAAVAVVSSHAIRDAIPELLRSIKDQANRDHATRALIALPDPRALPVYLQALSDRDADLRRAAQAALLAIRGEVGPELEKEARSGNYQGPAAVALERVLTRFQPVTAWRVIGPFARTTAQVFIGEASIDFDRTHSGVEGRPIRWAPRSGDPTTGRVVIDDFKQGSGDRGGFGYDTNGSPDLCAFGYAEVESDQDRSALLLVGSSGTVVMTLNEEPVHSFRDFAGRPYSPESDLVRVDLKKGRNRLLVQSRQGIGTWSFSVRVSEPNTFDLASKARLTSPEALRAYALKREGDPKRGESLFFDPNGVGCVKCHSANGQGTSTIGPDLTGLALKYDKTEIVRSVLEPSNRIATGYQPVLLATSDGQVHVGLIREETETYVDLADSDAKITRIQKSEVEERKVGEVSVMPLGLIESLSVTEFADLITYLNSLRQAPARPEKP